MATPNKKPTRKTILIVVEGYCEEIYFNFARPLYRNVGITVLRAKHSDSNSILKTAINESKKKIFDCIYCVYDTDTLETKQPSNYIKTKQEAINKKIKIIENKPCFEIWLLLHYQIVYTQLNSDQTIEQLKQYYFGYCKEQKWYQKQNIFENLHRHLDDAITNAKKITTYGGNEPPVYSKVYIIFEELTDWNKA